MAVEGCRSGSGRGREGRNGERREEGEGHVAIVTKKEDISIGFNGREKMRETFETESESLARPGISIYVETRQKGGTYLKSERWAALVLTAPG